MPLHPAEIRSPTPPDQPRRNSGHPQVQNGEHGRTRSRRETRLGADIQDDSCPPEARALGRTITRWRHQIVAWHHSHVSNGPTEAINNLVKRVKRVAFGITNVTNYRTRALLYTGRPNWDLLPTIQPR